VVHWCFDKASNERFAVKVVDLRALRDRQSLPACVLESQENEAQMLLTLQSDHVLRAVAVFRTADKMHVVLEPCLGGDLIDVTERHRRNKTWFSADQIEGIGLSVLHGLRDMHSLGIVHRDLKLDNLLFADAHATPENLKLADLGMAAAVPDGGLVADKAISTAEWMPPELQSGGTPHGTAVDMWSFGAVLYTLCTNIAPFGDRRQGLARLQQRICSVSLVHPLSDNIPGTCKCPEAWRRLVPLMRRCLQVEPADRPTAGEAIDEIMRMRMPVTRLNAHAAEFVPASFAASGCMGWTESALVPMNSCRIVLRVPAV